MELYNIHKSVWKVGKIVGLSGQTVHSKIQKLGFSDPDAWTEDDIALLSRFYTERVFVPKDKFTLNDLAAQLGRHKTNVCRKAKELGLTDQKRRLSAEFSEIMSDRSKEWHQNNGHPRGMLGKHHSPEERIKMSERSKLLWQGGCDSFVDGTSTLKGLKTKLENGTLYPSRPEGSVTWKGGKRHIAGKDIFFRSSWEFNYALYLQLLVEKKEILEWHHEPETFWFDGVTRGTRSYLPDFKVINLDGTSFFVEVKGWMDQRSKTKLNRMAKYYPEHTIVIVDGKIMRQIKNKFAKILPQWEFAK